jgi:hypothetical protein
MLVHETGLGERVIGLGIEVHRALGPAFLNPCTKSYKNNSSWLRGFVASLEFTQSQEQC